VAPPTSSSRNSKICTVQLRNPKWEVGGVIVTLFCEMDPTKSLNAAGYRFLNVSFLKIPPFRGVHDFMGPKMTLGWRLVAFNGSKKSFSP